MMKAVGALWRDADTETKEKYINMAKADRDRYSTHWACLLHCMYPKIFGLVYISKYPYFFVSLGIKMR